ncbi:MAG: hypothetical protein LBB81_09555 [Treponema sp.]|jgi:hypothetical protein|nr:hypothetical protein [Treponema sp.]
MTQTTQPRSWANLSETGKDLNINKPVAEDNTRLLLSIFDSLNTLCEKLSRLDYVIKRKNIEQILYRKGKGELVFASRSRPI